ncbi:hypothetical protein [Deinococcus cellulosilyticus]|nr:hypothetical protein [Deinococcus cellulosilyticus]
MWHSNLIFSAVKKGMTAELVDIGLTTLLFSLWTRLFRMGLDFSQVLRGVLCRQVFLGSVTAAITIVNQVATEGWVRQALPIHVALMQLAGGQPFKWTQGYVQVHLALVILCMVSLIFQLAQLSRRPLWYAALVVLLFGFLWTLPGGLSRAGLW